MPKEIYLVKVGMNMTEGVVDEWYVADGGQVQEGELLYRLETEKVNLDVDAEATGTVKHLVAEGVTKNRAMSLATSLRPTRLFRPIWRRSAVVRLRRVRPRLQRCREVAAPVPDQRLGDGGRVKSSPAARRLAGELGVDYVSLTGTGPGGRIVEADIRAAAAAGSRPAAEPAAADNQAARSSPIARKLARELGVDLGGIRGSGPGGRITKEDVEAAAAAAANRTLEGRPDTVVPVRAMRRTIAKRMFESLQSSAQLTMDMDVAMDEAVNLRRQLVEEWTDEGVNPTYTDLVIKAVSKALIKHPGMNAVFGEQEIRLRGDVNVGMAVALDDGLIVPVVRHADRLSVHDLAIESARLAAAARDGTLTPDELADGTFTVSALGMFGVDAFTPIINAPQSGILGVNRIRDDVAWDGDRPVKAQVMRLSLTWDHRVLDGAPAAQFLAAVRDLLEKPFRLLV